MILFATIIKQNRDKAWKSLRHEDGELCFGGGWFIVGIDTPEGSYTYHYEDKYFDLFDCEELERGKPWDGHTEKDVTRLLSLQQEPRWIPISERLPEIQQDVLLCLRSGVDVGFRNDAEPYYSIYINGYYVEPKDVLAWMLLPDMYEEESEE